MRPPTSSSLLLTIIVLTFSASARRSPLANGPSVQFRLETFVDVARVGPVGSLMDATFRVRALVSSPNVRVRIRLTDGLEFVGAQQTEWSGAMQVGQEVSMRTTIRAAHRGIFKVMLAARDTSPMENGGLVPLSSASGYIVAGTVAGFWSRAVDHRFEPPGRRGLRRALARALGLPSVPDSAHTSESFPLRRSQVRLTRLTRVLREIDTAGVDALFEDSLSQTRRVLDAINVDVREGSTSPEPSRVPPGEGGGENGGCPQYTVLRTGSLTYHSEIANAYLGLPHVRVEARDAHPLVGGSLIEQFWTDESGGFSVCMPYDAQGFTFISVFQDIGPLHVMRDGGDPPVFFPNMFGMPWNLNESPVIPLVATDNEVAFTLHTWHRGIPEATRLFGVSPEHVTSWYYNEPATDFYCAWNLPGVCPRLGNNIYTHRFTRDGHEYVWSIHGQFTRLHEYGHAFAHDVLNHRLIGECGDHNIWTPSDINCAASEGWADFFSEIALPIVETSGGSRAMEEYYFHIEDWRSFGPQGPETEGAVAAYLFDLVDGPGVPYFRYYQNDDEDVQVSFDYLVGVIRDGKVDNTLGQRVVEIIEIVDDVTPIPYKSEFPYYWQGQALSTRVTPPAGLTVSKNRLLWRWNLFGLTDAVPVVVTASVPGLVTVKSVQDLYGSASGGGGFYSGWEWKRSYEGGPWELWSNNQNSQFVAYAGQYTLGWRLTARDQLYSYDSDEQTTAVCIPYTGDCAPVLVGRPIAGVVADRRNAPSAGAEALGSGSSPQRGITPVDGVFGSGSWISGEAGSDSMAIQLYSLGGTHDAWTRDAAWPNALRSSVQVRSRSVSLGGRGLEVRETQEHVSQVRSVVRTRYRGLTPNSRYRLTFAVDPDLGTSPLDDRLVWVDSVGVAVVFDPDSGVSAYGWAGTSDPRRATIREYGARSDAQDPGAGREAYREQRERSRVLGVPGDIRFAMTLPPLPADARGELEVVFVEARGPSALGALAALLEVRARLGGGNSVSTPAESAGAPELAVHQYLGADGPAFGLSRRPSDSPSFSMTGRAPSASELARLRSEGITAVSLSVSAPGGAARIRVTVLDARGGVVRRAIDDAVESGVYVYRWDGLSDGGTRMPSGVYQVVVEGLGQRRRATLVLTR